MSWLWAAVAWGALALALLAAGLLVWAYMGYPLAIAFAARRWPRSPRPSKGAFSPRLTVVLTVRHEAQRVVARLQNLREVAQATGLAYELLVVDDASTDDETVDRVQALGWPELRVLTKVQRAGKADSLNRAAAIATGDILVFADARQRYAPDALIHLLAPFADPTIGAVSGELFIEPSVGGTGQGLDAYWRFEKWLRANEALFDSAVGCTGAIYAVRRERFRPIPPDTLIEDVWLPMQIAVQGDRIWFEPRAQAFDPQQLDPATEMGRKRRTLAGNFQLLARHGGWALPGGHRLWWQLGGHKFARVLGAIGLPALAAATVVVALRWPLLGLALGLPQVLLYGAAGIGAVAGQRAPRPFAWATGFVFLQAMVWAGLLYFWGGGYQHGWASSAPPSPSAPRR